MLEWMPEEGGRKVGHPAKRWRDDIEAVTATLLDSKAPGEWRIAAANRSEWQRLESEWLKEAGRQQQQQQQQRQQKRMPLEK